MTFVSNLCGWWILFSTFWVDDLCFQPSRLLNPFFQPSWSMNVFQSMWFMNLFPTRTVDDLSFFQTSVFGFVSSYWTDDSFFENPWSQGYSENLWVLIRIHGPMFHKMLKDTYNRHIMTYICHQNPHSTYKIINRWTYKCQVDIPTSHITVLNGQNFGYFGI